MLANDRRALAVYRLVVASSGQSNVGQLFHEAGPRQCVEALASVMEPAMACGEIRQMEPNLAAQQFLALLTTETNARVFEPDPQPIAPEAIHLKVRRAVDFFLTGAGARRK